MIVNPKGENGALIGFGVPVTQASDKELLTSPMSRGAYALATLDRRTVLKMMVLPRDEAGFEPEIVAQSALALGLGGELMARLRGTWTLAQLTFESHDAMVYPALDFLQNVAMRVAELSEGVIADPVSQRYFLPTELTHLPRADPKIDARDHVSVHFRTEPSGERAYTLGLQKFAQSELEISSLLSTDRSIAEAFLLVLAQTVLVGKLLKPGQSVGSEGQPFEVQTGGLDRALWEGISVLELLPPTRSSATEALAAWHLSWVR